ncbi:uncharacterized protein involved in type VI secretion and phage assembly [Rhizobium mongolense]|uniref:Uncharacterized protein involved in type VI secretion and phage assembly n=1 Tax=Rhizobium mongolense TaxID=57676 RepID=A0ABR6INC9_9HYPH|nr:uncharacterized protein involved in type VI secretion and phage assembly [Rhizobium mongolense]
MERADLEFLIRRFEEDGLFYWFSHEEGSHRLHIGDSASSWAGPWPSAQGEGRVRAQGSSSVLRVESAARFWWPSP